MAKREKLKRRNPLVVPMLKRTKAGPMKDKRRKLMEKARKDDDA
jgi:hypothetical protein